jgi:hypothetical protein
MLPGVTDCHAHRRIECARPARAAPAHLPAARRPGREDAGRRRARIISTLAEQYPAALRALSAPQAAFSGAAGGYLGAVAEPAEPAGPERTCIRLRLDDLAWFSAGSTDAIPLLRTVIARQTQTFRLGAGDGVLLSNTRWLHGRDPYSGRRTLLRVLGDPLPGTGIMPGFPSPAPATGTQTARAA